MNGRKNMERTKFRKAIQLLAESFGSSITPERIEIYYQHLGKIEEDIFANCINHLIESESFFPPIAKFVDIVKSKIEVPSQVEVHRELSKWAMIIDRNVETLNHPVLKMMAEETGLCDRFSVEMEDFDNAIKYRYNRIIDEYKMKMVSGEQLRLPVNNKRSLYPYASSKPKHLGSGFKKLEIGSDIEKLTVKIIEHKEES